MYPQGLALTLEHDLCKLGNDSSEQGKREGVKWVWVGVGAFDVVLTCGGSKTCFVSGSMLLKFFNLSSLLSLCALIPFLCVKPLTHSLTSSPSSSSSSSSSSSPDWISYTIVCPRLEDGLNLTHSLFHCFVLLSLPSFSVLIRVWPWRGTCTCVPGVGVRVCVPGVGVRTCVLPRGRGMYSASLG